MTAYVALLRAVNVGGRQLAMNDLKRVADELGLEKARTYIASGNLLFASGKTESALKAALEKALTAHLGKPVEAMIRTAAEMTDVVSSNPFAAEPGNRVVAIFFDGRPDADAVEKAANVADERLALGTREIYVHYPSGQGRSKLRLGTRASGTARNMNTVGKLAELAKELG
ncbi:MAG TPA: DUF1697 domain-containing protein [Sphingomicrobium sp.]|nr:DUF1697 domain-containing protein [Sphingomicrobium sp.]